MDTKLKDDALSPDSTGTSEALGPRAWNIWLHVDGVDVTFWYLICEYKMIIGAFDPTFRFAGAQARMKAQLLRDVIRRGDRDLLFEK